MLHRNVCPSMNLPPPLPDDVDLGLIEPMSTVAISEDSNTTTDTADEVYVKLEVALLSDPYLRFSWSIIINPKF